MLEGQQYDYGTIAILHEGCAPHSCPSAPAKHAHAGGKIVPTNIWGKEADTDSKEGICTTLSVACQHKGADELLLEPLIWLPAM